VSQLSTQFLKQVKEVVDSMHGRRSLILIDMTEIKPPSENMKEVAEIMWYARERNLIYIGGGYAWCSSANGGTTGCPTTF